MRLKLKIWRQEGPDQRGRLVDYELDDVSEHASFLEMLDVLNEKLVLEGERPVAFEHDCREGICGSCGMMINGQAHGPNARTTACQLHMRHFRDGDTIVMGGLVQEGEYLTQRKVPILASIPYLGRALFTAESKTKERSELVFFLTPRIVKTDVAGN